MDIVTDTEHVARRPQPEPMAGALDELAPDDITARQRQWLAEKLGIAEDGVDEWKKNHEGAFALLKKQMALPLFVNGHFAGGPPKHLAPKDALDDTWYAATVFKECAADLWAKLMQKTNGDQQQAVRLLCDIQQELPDTRDVKAMVLVVQKKIEELTEELTEELRPKCAICQEGVCFSTSLGGCGHRFCNDCIHDWVEHCPRKDGFPTCPLCREPFDTLFDTACCAKEDAIGMKIPRDDAAPTSSDTTGDEEVARQLHEGLQGTIEHLLPQQWQDRAEYDELRAVLERYVHLVQQDDASYRWQQVQPVYQRLLEQRRELRRARDEEEAQRHDAEAQEDQRVNDNQRDKERDRENACKKRGLARDNQLASGSSAPATSGDQPAPGTASPAGSDSSDMLITCPPVAASAATSGAEEAAAVAANLAAEEAAPAQDEGAADGTEASMTGAIGTNTSLLPVTTLASGSSSTSDAPLGATSGGQPASQPAAAEPAPEAVQDEGDPPEAQMIEKQYRNGNRYKGQVNDKGKKHGVGTFFFLNGEALISRFAVGECPVVGEGVLWNADRSKAWRTKDGEKVEEISSEAIEGIVKSLVGSLAVLVPPPPRKMVEEPYSNGDCYSGEMNVQGEKDGVGTYYYANGEAKVGRYGAGEDVGEGVWWNADRSKAWRLKDGKKVVEIEDAAAIAQSLGLSIPPPRKMVDKRYSNGDRYVGQINDQGKRHGVGTLHYRNGEALISRFEAGKAVGDGAWWNADRSKAWCTEYGEEVEDADADSANSLEAAKDIATSLVGSLSQPVPPPPREMSTIPEDSAYGVSYYVGEVNEKGEYHGVATFYNADDGYADISVWKDGARVGESVVWNAGRTKAWRLKFKKGFVFDDGKTISVEEAESAASSFGLPVPPQHKKTAKDVTDVLQRQCVKDDSLEYSLLACVNLLDHGQSSPLDAPVAEGEPTPLDRDRVVFMRDKAAAQPDLCHYSSVLRANIVSLDESNLDAVRVAFFANGKKSDQGACLDMICAWLREPRAKPLLVVAHNGDNARFAAYVYHEEGQQIAAPSAEQGWTPPPWLDATRYDTSLLMIAALKEHNLSPFKLDPATKMPVLKQFIEALAANGYPEAELPDTTPKGKCRRDGNVQKKSWQHDPKTKPLQEKLTILHGAQMSTPVSKDLRLLCRLASPSCTNAYDIVWVMDKTDKQWYYGLTEAGCEALVALAGKHTPLTLQAYRTTRNRERSPEKILVESAELLGLGLTKHENGETILDPDQCSPELGTAAVELSEALKEVTMSETNANAQKYTVALERFRLCRQQRSDAYDAAASSNSTNAAPGGAAADAVETNAAVDEMVVDAPGGASVDAEAAPPVETVVDAPNGSTAVDMGMPAPDAPASSAAVATDATPSVVETPTLVTIPAGSTVLGPQRDEPSRYWERYIDESFEAELLAFCRNDVHYQLYQNVAPFQSPVWRHKAPKAEFYVLTPDGLRPVYKWTQTRDFFHAGLPMPQVLQRLLDKLNADFGLRGENTLNHIIIIINEQSGRDPTTAHHGPPHTDKIKTGRFFDLSLGYAREFQLIDAVDKKTVVASQRLASASLAYISAADNGHGPDNADARYQHTVRIDAEQPVDQPRFTIVARAIVPRADGKDSGEHFRPVDEAAAARVRLGGDLWKEYVPRFRAASSAAKPTIEFTEPTFELTGFYNAGPLSKDAARLLQCSPLKEKFTEGKTLRLPVGSRHQTLSGVWLWAELQCEDEKMPIVIFKEHPSQTVKILVHDADLKAHKTLKDAVAAAVAHLGTAVVESSSAKRAREGDDGQDKSSKCTRTLRSGGKPS